MSTTESASSTPAAAPAEQPVEQPAPKKAGIGKRILTYIVGLIVAERRDLRLQLLHQ